MSDSTRLFARDTRLTRVHCNSKLSCIHNLTLTSNCVHHENIVGAVDKKSYGFESIALEEAKISSSASGSSHYYIRRDVISF
jgi:hypothetical protein